MCEISKDMDPVFRRSFLLWDAVCSRRSRVDLLIQAPLRVGDRLSRGGAGIGRADGMMMVPGQVTIVPLSVPAIAAMSIFTFNFYWNDFFNPLIFLDTPANFTLPVGLSMLQGQYAGTSPAVMLAGVCMAVVPVLVVFLVGQRYIVEGVTLTGLKG